MANAEMVSWLGEVIRMTKSETIKWRVLNPTTYAWEITSPRVAKVVLQKVTKAENVIVQDAVGRRVAQKKTSTGYMMQVSETSSPAIPPIAINSSDDPEIATILEELFKTVSEVATNENVRFLKSLLPEEPH